MKLRSLRLRLLLLAAVTLVATLLVAGASLVFIFERHLERRVEQELRVRLAELEAALDVTEENRPGIGRVLSDPRYDKPYGGSYWQISEGDAPVQRSRSLWEEQLPFGDGKEVGPDAAAFEVEGPQGSTLYVLQRDVTLEEGGTPRRYRLMVALDHADIDELGASFRADVTRALSLIAAVLLAGAWLQTSVGLRPLRRMRAELGAIRSGAARRLRGIFPEEVTPLVTDLNLLLDRQEETVANARKRAGDLAHGLKTPLTILTGEARRLDDAGLRQSAQTLREQIGLMRGHVERELARARTHGVAVAGGTLTDGARTAERLVGLMQRMPRGDVLAWKVDVDPALRLFMDPADFGEVVGNILDNARKWARSRVTVSASLSGDRARITVEDDGPGIDPAAKSRIRQRGEQAQYDEHGSGLGIAIAGDVLAEYGSELEIAQAVPSGCVVGFEIRATWAAQAVENAADPADRSAA
jgi:signal transduction histidine kinase